jgi:hypothetical protein
VFRRALGRVGRSVVNYVNRFLFSSSRVIYLNVFDFP